jgi:phosphomevalonate kinase
VTALVASAPGKAVLIGEYAVLEGAPAIVMAAGPRARASLRPADGPSHRAVSLNGGARAAFRAERGGIEWLEGAGDDFALLEHVWRAAGADPAGAVELVLDTRGFFDPATGAKLGFGSSAALCVALVAVLAGPAAGRDAVQRAALAAHRDFQRGRGSGVDVAAAVHGGVLAFRRDGPRVERLAWPAGLEACLLWSGRAAATADRIGQFSRVPAQARQALLAAAEDACGEWAHGALSALSAWSEALWTFGRESGLGIFAAGHEALYAEARRRGIVYKPCGAGGGDVGAAFAPEVAPLEAFAAWAAEHGFRRLTAARDDTGVAMESGTA